MSAPTQPAGNEPKKDLRREVMEALVKADQAKQKAAFDDTEVLHQVLKKADYVQKDADGAPIYASIIGHEQALANDVVGTYKNMLNTRYNFSDRLTNEKGHRFMEWLTGKNEQEWKANIRSQGMNVSSTGLAEFRDNYQGVFSEELEPVQMKLQEVYLKGKSGRHQLLKLGGLEEIIGKEDEPVDAKTLISSAIRKTQTDRKLYNQVAAEVYDLGGNKH
jgi:hypothetical protein